jgi:hypothetical protein
LKPVSGHLNAQWAALAAYLPAPAIRVMEHTKLDVSAFRNEQGMRFFIKRLTCRDLGGPCDAEFAAASFAAHLSDANSMRSATPEQQKATWPSSSGSLMRLRTSDAPDGDGGNKWQRTGPNDGAADPNCPGSRSGPKCPHPRAGLVAIFELQGRQFWKRRPSLPTHRMTCEFPVTP